MLPCGLLISLCTLRVCRCLKHATLDTGRWLALARQGLSPCKKCQAYLGARVLRLQVPTLQRWNPVRDAPASSLIGSTRYSSARA